VSNVTPRHEPSHIEKLCCDIDLRLADFWRIAFENDCDDLTMLGEFMRCAYAKGHNDALTDPAPESFYRDHGYAPPRRQGER
jgi:hypothetical protein